VFPDVISGNLETQQVLVLPAMFQAVSNQLQKKNERVMDIIPNLFGWGSRFLIIRHVCA